MVQLYFLIVLVNILTGLALAKESLAQRFNSLSRVGELLEEKEGLRLGLGSAAVVLGVLKLFLVFPGNWVILGDFLVAVTGVIAGTALLVDSGKKETVESAGLFAAGKEFLLAHKKLFGYLALFAAVLHFVLPGIILL